MIPCACNEPHDRRRIVLTGGPGAGKTAVLELIRQAFQAQVYSVIPKPVNKSVLLHTLARALGQSLRKP